MKALILAAGLGSRLMPLTASVPKCMVTYHGKAIIDYVIRALQEGGIRDIAVVGGYQYRVLEAYMQSQHIKHIYENPHYATSNMVATMFCAREWIQACIKERCDLIISYADIVYFAPFITKLCASKYPLSIVIDRDWERLWRMRFNDVLSDAESLRLQATQYNNTKAYKILELGKKPNSISDIEGQYIGLFKIQSDFLPNMLDAYDTLDEHASYEDKDKASDKASMYMTSFLQLLINRFNNAYAIEVHGGWCEIDTLKDIALPMPQP